MTHWLTVRATWLLIGMALAAAFAIHLASPGDVDPGPHLPPGYHPGAYQGVGTGPDIHGGGTVTWQPIPVPPAGMLPEPPITTPAAVPSPPGGGDTPCDLGSLEVSLECAFDAYTAGVPWGRIVGSGSLAGWGQRRVLPPTVASELDLRVAPRLRPLPWLVEGRVLAVGPDPGIRLGVAWYRTGRRWGITADVDRTWRDVVVPGSYYQSDTIKREASTTVGLGVAWRGGGR